MIEVWILKWWPIIVGLLTVIGGDCVLRIRAINYLHKLILLRVEKESFDNEINRINKKIDLIGSRIDIKIESIIQQNTEIAVQNGRIAIKLENIEKGYIASDEHLRELLRITPNRKN